MARSRIFADDAKHRGAFLSVSQPVARRDFEATLEKADALLGERGGPFFVEESPTAPTCWAPFLNARRSRCCSTTVSGRATRRAILA